MAKVIKNAGDLHGDPDSLDPGVQEIEIIIDMNGGNWQFLDYGAPESPAGGPPTAYSIIVYGNALNNTIGVHGDNISRTAIIGASGSDTITGSSGNDTIYGDFLESNTIPPSPGNDLIHGGAGDDFLVGGEGDNTVDGGDGNDFIRPGAIHTSVGHGGNGNDTVIGGFTIYGEAGNDSMSGRDVYGGDGNDTLAGTSVFGGNGDDRMTGTALNDFLIGEKGRDTLEGGEGADKLIGDLYGSGNEVDFFIFRDNTGMDTIQGFNRDSDKIVVQKFVNGTTIDDVGDLAARAQATPEGVAINLGGGYQGVGNILRITGAFTLADVQANPAKFFIVSDNPDTVTAAGATGAPAPSTTGGSPGADTLTGGNGFDDFDGGAGNDSIDGRAGNDIIAGGNGNDTVIGGSGNDNVFGGAGADQIAGGNGDDVLVGGAGDDILLGDGSTTQGYDIFKFGDGSGRDAINDFNAALDQIVVLAHVNGTTIENAGDLAARASALAGTTGVLVDLGGGNALTILGVTIVDVRADPNAYFTVTSLF